MRKRHHNHLSLFLLSMHLSDRRSYLLSLNISVPARARAKNPHIFKKKAEEKKEEKRLHAPFIARTLTVVDRTLEDLVDRTAEEEPIMVDRACAEENIFFSLCCRTQKKEARVENMMLFFFEREFDRVVFFSQPETRETNEQRESAFSLSKRLSPLPPEKRPHVLFFVSCLFCFFSLDVCAFPFGFVHFWHPSKKIQKKKSSKHFSLLCSHSHLISAQTDARAFTTTNDYNNKRSLFLLLGK